MSWKSILTFFKPVLVKMAVWLLKRSHAVLSEVYDEFMHALNETARENDNNLTQENVGMVIAHKEKAIYKVKSPRGELL